MADIDMKPTKKLAWMVHKDAVTEWRSFDIEFKNKLAAQKISWVLDEAAIARKRSPMPMCIDLPDYDEDADAEGMEFYTFRMGIYAKQSLILKRWRDQEDIIEGACSVAVSTLLSFFTPTARAVTIATKHLPLVYDAIGSSAVEVQWTKLWADMKLTFGPQSEQDRMRLRSEWLALRDHGMSFTAFYMEWDRLTSELGALGFLPNDAEQEAAMLDALSNPEARRVFQDTINERLHPPMPVPRVHSIANFFQRCLGLAAYMPDFDNGFRTKAMAANIAAGKSNPYSDKTQAAQAGRGQGGRNSGGGRGNSGGGRYENQKGGGREDSRGGRGYRGGGRDQGGGRGSGGARGNSGGRGRGGQRDSGSGAGAGGYADSKYGPGEAHPNPRQRRANSDQGTRMALSGCWRCGRADHVKHDKATDSWCSATSCSICNAHIGNDNHDASSCQLKRSAGSQDGTEPKRGRS